MKIDFKFGAILVLIIIIVAQFFYYDYQKSKVERETIKLKNELVARDSIALEKDSSYSRLSFELDSQKDLYKLLEQSNAQLAYQMKKKDEQIAYLMSVVVKVDTVYIDTSKTVITDSVAYFSGYTRPYSVSGEVHFKESQTKNLKVKMDDFKLTIVESKLDSGFFKARLKFTDMFDRPLEMFKVIDLTSAVNIEQCKEYEPPFLNIGIGGTVNAYDFNAGVLLNFYDKNIFTINYRINNNEILNNNKIENRITIGYYRILF